VALPELLRSLGEKKRRGKKKEILEDSSARQHCRLSTFNLNSLAGIMVLYQTG